MRILYTLLLIVTSMAVFAQPATLSGVVQHGGGGPLPLANVLLLPDSVWASTGENGIFTLRTVRGQKTLVVTYTGFATARVTFVVRSDTAVAVVLNEETSQLGAVTVEADRYSSADLVETTRTGTTRLTRKEVNAIPVLGGEADVIKALQLLPGTVKGIEGSADLFVRGGAADQNLVLLDGAPVYNTSHLFGFVSVFNPDMLESVEAIHGGFPAEYGGRLSSILRIRTRHDVAQTTKVSGDVGLIATRLYVEQPLLKDKASIWIAGRRTYIDQVTRAVGESLPYFFYDINGKLILTPTNRDKVEFAMYTGEDLLDLFRDRNNDGYGFLTAYASGNRSESLRWSHTTPSQWRSTLLFSRTRYRYDIRNHFEDNQFRALSDIEDYSVAWTFGTDSLANGSLDFGLHWTRHVISPHVISTAGSIAELVESSFAPGISAQEVAAHGQREFNLSPRLRVNAGFRLSGGITAPRTYLVPEPRLSLRYALDDQQSLKFSYARMAQYMHRISNSAVTTPADVWYTITDDIAPQTSHQIGLAWQRWLAPERLFLSLEAYHKQMNNLIGYEEGTNLFFNTDFTSRLLQGRGRATGVELLVRKETGRLTGWISYTLSWSTRQFDGINDGEWFRARYDRRHNGALVGQYALHDRWALSMVWEFISGARFTPVVGKYAVLAPTHTGVDLIPLYAGINAVKLADSHRLDAGVKFMSKPDSKVAWQLFAGVYNLYNRASPVGIVIEQDETDGSLRYRQPGLFGIIPFISYGFNF